MKAFPALVLLTACLWPTGSVPGQLLASNTAQLASPQALSDVRVGMDKEMVLAGLSAHNAVVRWSSIPRNKDVPGAQDYDNWVVVSKAGLNYVTEKGSVTFSNGKVRETDEFLTETESPDTAKFVRDLSADLEQHAKPAANIVGGMASMRVADVAATIEIEENSFLISTGREEHSVIRIKLKDVTFQVSVFESSDSTSPVVKIRRIRGK
jgi:hypothetical protein